MDFYDLAQASLGMKTGISMIFPAGCYLFVTTEAAYSITIEV